MPRNFESLFSSKKDNDRDNNRDNDRDKEKDNKKDKYKYNNKDNDKYNGKDNGEDNDNPCFHLDNNHSPPLADKDLLVENCSVGAKERDWVECFRVLRLLEN